MQFVRIIASLLIDPEIQIVNVEKIYTMHLNLELHFFYFFCSRNDWMINLSF